MDNEFLPQLHADLWSDYFGAFVPPGQRRAAIGRITASTQSVLGLVADALAIGGLCLFGIPALTRGFRRRDCQTLDTPYGLLALLALLGTIALAVQVIRYPQALGLEIKASYLLFTAPCWAIFSVAAWVRVAGRSAKLKSALAVAAGLYVLSYGTTLAAAFTQPFDQRLSIVQPEAYPDLDVSIDNMTSGRPEVTGTEQDFTIWIESKGAAGAVNPLLVIDLDPGLRLLGPPHAERGPGCTGGQTITCPLDFLRAGTSTPVRFGVELTEPGAQRITATVRSDGMDATPADNEATYFLSPIANPG